MQKMLAIPVLILAMTSLACSEKPRESVMSKEPAAAPRADDPYQAESRAELQIAEGQLVRIDSKNDLIWVKLPDGKEMQFSYTLMTDVEGGGDATEGLVDDVEAIAKGTTVRVHYKPGVDRDVLSADEVNPAVKIEIARAL